MGYTVSKDETKVAAGWLIDQAGWKGYRKGDAGIHKNQALYWLTTETPREKS